MEQGPTTAYASYAHIPAWDRPRRTAVALIITALHIVWAAVKFWIAVGKLVEFDDMDYVRHYTNWSWTFQALFFSATIGIAFVEVGWLRHDSAYSQWLQFVTALFFFPLLGVVITVRVLVWVLLGTNSPFLQKFFDKMAPSFVMLGDDAFHFMPVIEVVVFWLVYRKWIYYSLNQLIATTEMLDAPVRYTLFILYQAYILALGTVVVYWFTNDPHKVYSTDVPDEYGFAVIIITLTVFVLMPLIYVLWLLRVASPRAYTANWLHRNDVDPYVVSRYVDDAAGSLVDATIVFTGASASSSSSSTSSASAPKMRTN